MKQRIFISGPMTGKDQFNKLEFDKAAKKLRELGHLVVNPVDLDVIVLGEDYYKKKTDNSEFNEKHINILKIIEKQILLTCDCIYLLDGWENSEGAKAELKQALDFGLRVWSHNDLVKHNIS